jgi:hypothetical protein
VNEQAITPLGRDSLRFYRSSFRINRNLETNQNRSMAGFATPQTAYALGNQKPLQTSSLVSS